MLFFHQVCMRDDHTNALAKGAYREEIVAVALTEDAHIPLTQKILNTKLYFYACIKSYGLTLMT